MMTDRTENRTVLRLVVSLAFVAIMLALIFLDPFGPASLWIVLAISFGVTGWGIRQRLRSRDEVMSEAFKMSFVYGAPIAIILSIITVAFASRIDGFRDFILYSWPETTNDPRMVGFGLGISFTAILFSLCVCIARAGWWLARK